MNYRRVYIHIYIYPTLRRDKRDGGNRKRKRLSKRIERGQREQKEGVASFSNCSNLESIRSLYRRGAKTRRCGFDRTHFIGWRKIIKLRNQTVYIVRSSSCRSALWKITGGNCQLINDRAAILQRKGQFTAIDRFTRTRLSTRAVTIRRTLESGVGWYIVRLGPTIENPPRNGKRSRCEMKGKGGEDCRVISFSFPYIFHRWIFDMRKSQHPKVKNSRSEGNKRAIKQGIERCLAWSEI